jgi:hypothetical protein
MKPGDELRALGLGMMMLLASMRPALAVDDLETGDLNPTNVGAATTKKQDDGPSLVAMPIPMSNPTVGSGARPGRRRPLSTSRREQPWGTGIGGLYTSTSSYAFGTGRRANFNGDRYRLEAGLGYGSCNLSFYGVGSALAQHGVAIPINQTGYGTQITGLARVFENFYLGFNYQYLHRLNNLTKVGAGLEVDLSDSHVVIDRLRIVGRYVFGPSVSGFSVGLGISF